MKFKKIISLLLAASMLCGGASAIMAEENTKIEVPAYLNEELSFEERAADLVSRMTLEEKVAQLGYSAPAIDRLGVSKYNYWRECLHGVARQGVATSFPTSLSLSNTWNTELIERVADVTSTEARAKNSKTDLSYYTPTVNMARDPRWGRNEETYGEDPYLTGQIGGAFVKGMQGDDEKYTKIIATIKHFAANNNEANRRGGTSVMNEFTFRNYYTKAFQNVTDEVMPGSVMSSYNATSIYRNGELLYNYIPSAANSYLLTDLLRRNWGFSGYVTTDCGAGEDMIKNEAYKKGILGNSTSANEAYIAAALKAGMDVECNLGGGNASVANGINAVKNGYISEEQLETSIYHMFLQRFKTGEFDSNASYRDIEKSVIECDENVAAAEEAAEESFVLLKNDNALPLARDSKIAVVGNMANTLALGDYTGSPTKTVTPIEGITAAFGADNVNHLGAVSDNELLYNVKSITLVLKDGSTRAVDLSKATSVSGMTLSNGSFLDVTPSASAVISGISFTDVASVRVEMAQGSLMGGSLNIAYGNGGPTVAAISSAATADTNTYTVCEADYTGEDGGYNGTADMYISASPAVAPFSITAYKAELDAADTIIAYAGTVPKQDGFGDADSSESKDRSSINLPESQSHVQEICTAYPDKTVVVMSTVGQINVEPFMDKCRAILWTSYNGQTQGTALGKILTGDVNPSGRLSTTWYRNDDVNKMVLSNRTKQTVNGIEGYYTNYDIQPDGTRPGNTYQYYSGTPVYPFGYGLSYTSFEYSDISIDKTEVDANGTVTVSVKVKNTGDTEGAEVVQLYAAHPGAGSRNLPKKQLKGFSKIKLAAGEEKTVSISLDVSDMALYSESLVKNEVLNGTYTAYIGKNADDESNALQFNVSGALKSELKTVKAMPDGITLTGLICEDGTGLEEKTAITSNVSAVMSDEAICDMTKTPVTYASSDSSVAQVDENGRVTSGTKEGTALITASVTIDGVTKTDTYPVVNTLLIKPSAAQYEAASAELKAAYDSLPAEAYTAETYSELTAIYNSALSDINAAETTDILNELLTAALAELRSVPMDNLAQSYTIKSENENYIVSNVLDYRTGGITPYNGASGTVTEINPYSGIMLNAVDDSGNTQNVTWSLRQLGDTSRKAAEIDSETGELTVYGNGIVEIIAADLPNAKCGRMVLHINMQIEGEYADDADGANLLDTQSGTSGGKNVGSTSSSWILYKSVKLKNLESIAIRYSGKNDCVVNVSLEKSVTSGLIASGTAISTSGWNKWNETELELDTAAIRSASLDENGCADIYIQTNGTNLDYFKLTYTEINDDIPYVIEKVQNKADGVIKAFIKYRGSAEAEEATLKVQTSKGAAETKICGSGEYDIASKASNGENITVTVYSKDGNALSEPFTSVYRTPVDSEIIVYSLDSTDYDYSVLTGGTDSTPFGTTVNGLSGYGSWTMKKASSAYTYTDINDKEYEYSFTNAWQAGKGSETNRNLYFTPKSSCRVTVLFNGAVGRDMYISQNGSVIATGLGTGSDNSFSAVVTDTSSPVYVYGGSSNKNLFAVFVEYYAETEEETPAPTTEPTTAAAISYNNGEVTVSSSIDTDAVLIHAAYTDGTLSGIQLYPLTLTAGTAVTKNITANDGDKLMLWNSMVGQKPLSDALTVINHEIVNGEETLLVTQWGESDVLLARDIESGDTSLYALAAGDIRIPINTEVFYSKPDGCKDGDKYVINTLAQYNGRLYAGCNEGYIMMITDCAKCYRLYKPADFDITEMSITGRTMTIGNGQLTNEISLDELYGNSVEPEEARFLIDSGAVLIDVRDSADFDAAHIEGAINIPLADIASAAEMYDTDTVIVLCCTTGTKASAALNILYGMGYTNIYNAGAYTGLM